MSRLYVAFNYWFGFSSDFLEEWKKPIRYVTIYLQDRRGTASPRYRNHGRNHRSLCVNSGPTDLLE